MLERLAEINDFAPDSDDVANLNGAMIQGLQRLAADTDSFRSRNRGGAFTAEHSGLLPQLRYRGIRR